MAQCTPSMVFMQLTEGSILPYVLLVYYQCPIQTFYTFEETFSCACVTSFYCLKSCCWSGSSQPSPKLMLINSHSGYIHGLFFTTLPKVIPTELNIVMYGHNICFNVNKPLQGMAPTPPSPTKCPLNACSL